MKVSTRNVRMLVRSSVNGRKQSSTTIEFTRDQQNFVIAHQQPNEIVVVVINKSFSASFYFNQFNERDPGYIDQCDNLEEMVDYVIEDLKQSFIHCDHPSIEYLMDCIRIV